MCDNNGQSDISSVTEEKDLGVTFQPNLKFDKHIDNSVLKANRVLVVIRNSFEYLEKDTFLTLYKSLIRPRLEYGTSVWNPHLKKDIRRIERVQRRATKIVPGVYNRS